MVGILTFHWADDYGAMLQACALKRMLESMGVQTEIIPYAPLKLTGRYWPCPLYAKVRNGKLRYYFSRYSFRMLSRNLLSGGQLWVRRRNMRAFRRQYLTAQSPIRSPKELSLEQYSCVFVGSDQVWNPVITVDLDDAYTGNLPHRGGCRLVSYGASFGGDPLTDSDRETFIAHVGSSFSALSVRERPDAVLAGQLLRRKVYDVLDPVLLLERPAWEELAALPPDKDYILLYATQPSVELARYARSLSAQLGKRVIQVSSSAVAAGPGLELRAEGGPAQFVGYVQNAFCVLTNSFHGTAFSVLLEKPFLAFRPASRGLRLEDLLDKLGLLSHLVEEGGSFDPSAIWAGTHWDSVRRLLDEERARSMRFLSDSLRGLEGRPHGGRGDS